MIRLATAADAIEIAAIYHPIVVHTPTSFEMIPPDQLEIAQRIEKKYPSFPWIVFESNQKVLGYAYAGSHRSRAAYQWSVETSVYVHPDHHRKGIARQLYSCLLEILKIQGFQMAYAGIVVPNEASVGFHQSLGFSLVGVYENVGFKQGKWHSVSWLSLVIGDLQNNPVDPLNLEEVSAALLDAIWRKYV